MAIRSRSIRSIVARESGARLLGLCLLVVLLSCSGDNAAGVDGSVVRISLAGLDPSTTRAKLTVSAQDKQGMTKTADSDFQSGPFDVLGVTFPPGTMALTTYQVDVFRDSCLLGTGTVTQLIDHDGSYDVTVQLTPPPLTCGAPAGRLVVQVVNGVGGSGAVTTVGAPDIDCGAKCSQVYAVPSSIMLQATATLGGFQSWSGACTGSSVQCTVNLNQEGDTVVQAVFAAAGGCRGWCEENSGVTDNLLSVWGSGPLNVYAVGENGAIVKWDGQSWSKQPAPSPATTLRGITFPRDGGGYVIVGDGGTILGTAGKLTSPSGTTNLNAVAAYSASNVFIVGDNGTLLVGTTTGSFGAKSNNGGYGNPPSSQAGVKLTAIGVAASGDNYSYGGSQGYNLRRHRDFFGVDVFDNGASGTTQNLTGISFGSNYIFAVGPQGTFVSRGPKGNSFPNWTVQTSPATVGLQGVWSAADNKVYAVGDALTILYWDGAVLSKVPLPNITANLTRKLNAVWGTSATNVYAVGDNGTILHYLP